MIYIEQPYCLHELFVQIKWQDRNLSVPLMQLEGIDVDEETKQVLGDWSYWVAKGHQF